MHSSKAMMPLQLLSIFTFISLLLPQVFSSPLVVKTGCQDHCGNLSIPYPFGVGLDCSLDPSFTVSCDTSTDPPKAFLSVIDKEVIEINETYIRVKYPNLVAVACYDKSGESYKNSSMSVNLTGTPYTLSKMNTLTAIGCDDMVLGILQSNVSFVGGGCSAFCTGKNDTGGIGYCPNNSTSSLSNGCCQTSSFSDGQDFLGAELVDLSVKLVRRKLFPCSYAFVQEMFENETVFSYPLFYLDNTTAFLNDNWASTTRPPVVQLNWRVVGADNCSQAVLNPATYACMAKRSVCNQYGSDYYPYNDVRGYRCSCVPGYEGNPYLSGGCNLNFGKMKGAGAKDAAQGIKRPRPATQAFPSSDLGPQLGQLGRAAVESSPPRQRKKPAAVVDLSGEAASSSELPGQLEGLPIAEGIGKMASWLGLIAARQEDELDRYSEQLTAARAKLKKANDEMKAVKAELARQLAKTSKAEDRARRLEAELEAANDGQGEVLRAYTKRLLLSGHFSALANELAELINGSSALFALEEAAKEFPDLEVSKFGYERLEDAVLLSRYAEVIRSHLGRIPLLNELASSPELLKAEQVAACPTDRDPYLEAAFDALPEDEEKEEAEQEEKADEDPTSSRGAEGSRAAEAEDVGAGLTAGKQLTPEKETAASIDVNSLREQIARLSGELAEKQNIARIWRDKYRRAEELYSAKSDMLEVTESELADCRLRIEAVCVAAEEKQRAGQEAADELQAKLLQAEEALEVARGRADRVLKDHERIVEEHAEYEEIIRRNGGITISEAEEQTREYLEQYLELKRVCGPDAPELRGAYEMLEERAKTYEIVLSRRPKLRALLGQNVGEAGSSSSQVAPRRRQPQIGPSRGGRASGRGSSGTRGRRSSSVRGQSRGRGRGRISIDDIMGATSFEDTWLNFSRPGPSS